MVIKNLQLSIKRKDFLSGFRIILIVGLLMGLFSPLMAYDADFPNTQYPSTLRYWLDASDGAENGSGSEAAFGEDVALWNNKEDGQTYTYADLEGETPMELVDGVRSVYFGGSDDVGYFSNETPNSLGFSGNDPRTIMLVVKAHSSQPHPNDAFILGWQPSGDAGGKAFRIYDTYYGDEGSSYYWGGGRLTTSNHFNIIIIEVPDMTDATADDMKIYKNSAVNNLGLGTKINGTNANVNIFNTNASTQVRIADRDVSGDDDNNEFKGWYSEVIVIAEDNDDNKRKELVEWAAIKWKIKDTVDTDNDGIFDIDDFSATNNSVTAVGTIESNQEHTYSGITFTIQGTTEGSYSKLDFETNSVTLNVSGRLTVDLDGYTPSLGDSWDFMDWGTLGGEFEDIDLPELSSGLAWDLSSFYTTGTLSVIEVIGSLSSTASVWFDASDTGSIGNVSSGDDVSVWVNKIGSDANLTQNITLKKPSYNAVALNNLPAIEFNGSTDELEGIANSFPTSGESYTAFVVLQSDASTGEDRYVFSSRPSPNVSKQSFSLTSPESSQVVYADEWYGDSNTSEKALNYGDFGLVAMRYDGAGSGRTIFVNGSTSGTDSSTDFDGVGDYVTVGSHGGEFYFDGKISELLIFQEALSNQDRYELSYLLSQKWNLEKVLDSDDDSVIDFYDVYPTDNTRAFGNINFASDYSVQTTHNVTIMLEGDSINNTLDATGHTLSLGGTLTVTIESGFTPDLGDSWDIMNGTLSGQFSDVALPSLTAGLAWDLDELYTTGTLTVISVLGGGISAPTLWLDGSDLGSLGNINTGDGVALWIDKSGSNAHASQNSSAKQPTYNPTGFGTGPGIVFDGVDDGFVLDNGRLPVGNENYAVFIVASIADSGVNQTFLSSGEESDNQQFKISVSGNSGLIEDTWYANDYQSKQVIQDELIVVNSSYDNSSGRSMYVNGTYYSDADVSSNTNFSATSTNASIGMFMPDESDFLSGTISEIIVFESLLTEQERINISYDLAQKWNLELVMDSDNDSVFDFYDVFPTDNTRAYGNITLTSNYTVRATHNVTVMLEEDGLNNTLDATGYTLDLNGTLNVTIESGFTPEAGDSWDLLNGTLNGYFDDVNMPALNEGLAWDFDALYSTGTLAVISVPGAISVAPKIWFDSTDYGSMNLDGSDYVSKWLDKSGRNSHASQPNLSNQPTYNTTGLNSLPGITFDGASTGLDLGNNTLPTSGNSYSVFLIASIKEDNDAETGHFLLHSGTLDTPNESFIISKSQDYSGYEDSWYGNDVEFGTWVTDNPVILTSRFSNSVGRSMFINGQPYSDQVGTDASNTNFQANGSNSSIGYAAGVDSNYVDGVISEILIFDEALATQDRINVTYGLSTKWDMTLVTDSDDDNVLDFSDGAPTNSATAAGTIVYSGNFNTATELDDDGYFVLLEGNGSNNTFAPTGLLTMGGTLNITIKDGYTPLAGDTFDIFDWGSRAGGFTNFNFDELPAGLGWDLDLLYETGVISVVSIPGNINVTPILWISPDDRGAIVTNNLTTVERLIDKTHHENHFRAYTTNKQATLVESGDKGLAELSFNQDTYGTVDKSLYGGQENTYTQIAVIKPTALGLGNRSIISGDPNSEQRLYVQAGNIKVDHNNTNFLNDTTAISVNNYYIVFSRVDSDNDYGELRVNGSLKSTYSGTVPAHTDTGYTFIGSESSSEYFEGNIGEILIYNQAISTQNVYDLTHGLAVKWAVTDIVDSDNDRLLDENDRQPTNNAQMDVSGNVTISLDPSLNSSQTISFRIRDSLDYDSLDVNTLFSIGGTLSIVLDNVYEPVEGDSFDFLDWNSKNGQFEDVTLPTLNSGLAWDLSQLYSAGVIAVTESPGGISSAPSVWLDASDTGSLGNIDSGDPISIWLDKSGNGFHASQTASDQQPTYNSSGLNNKPGIIFDGANDGLTMPDHSLPVSAENYSVFAVVNITGENDLANSQFIISSGINSANGSFSLGKRDASGAFFDSWNSNDYDGESYTANTDAIVTSRYSTSSGRTLYVDGTYTEDTAGSNDASTSFAATSANASIGFSKSTGSGYLKGVISEILIFEEALSDQDRINLTHYLSQKWGLESVTDSDDDTLKDSQERNPTENLILSPSGNISVTNDILMTTANNLVFQVRSASNYDSLSVNGTVTFNGLLTIVNDGHTFLDGDGFEFLEWNSTSGTFNNLSLPTLGSGVSWVLDNLYVGGGLSVANLPFSLDKSVGLWLDATDSASFLNEDGAVSRWFDKSGNNRHVSANAYASRPTVSEAVQNSLDTLSFSGNPMTFIKEASLQADGFTTAFIVKIDSSSFNSSDHLFFNNSQLRLRKPSGSNIQVSLFDSSWNDFSSKPIVGGAYYLLLVTFDETYLTVRINGTPTQGDASAISLAGNASGSVLSQSSFYGNLGEVLIFDEALSENEMIQLEKYLSRKWGIYANSSQNVFLFNGI